MHEDAHQPPPSPPPPPFSPNEAADEAELLEPGTFYKYDTRRVTFREYLFETKNPLVLAIAGIARLLRIRIPGGSTDDPNVEHLAPFEVAESAFPDDVRAQLAPLISELVSLGFHTPVFHEITDALHATRHHLVSFCHPSSHAVARVHLRVWRRFHPPRVYLFTEFITSFTDDTFLWSLSSKPDMIAPPNCRVNRHVGMSPTDLWKSHQHELAKEKGKSILTAHDRYELIDVLERHHAALRDFHLKRGVFVPLTDADRKQAATIQENERAVAASGMEHAEVLAEIEKLQNQRAGWGSAIFILVVSVFLFLGAGSRQWEWEYLLILMGVLFFHELGHYIAMRVFGYRNLRMFFIPFLGAAVSGRNYNVPGWKKVVVSLMGPVPGIILGAIIGMLGIILNRPQLVMVGIMSLILNGFNLLPVLPLDGGWVMHALLFSRHYLLDVAFRAIAAAVLLLGGFASGDRVLMIIGGITLLSLPMAYKLARLTTDLRRSGMQGVSPDDQTIPAPVAQTIISRVKEAFPKGVNNKMIAQHTLHVFETLNARPPGIAASIGLGIVHGGSFLAAILFVALLAIQQRGGLDAFRRLGSNPFPEPRYTLDPAAIREYRPVGAQPPADPASRVAVVATFDSRPTAQQHFDQLKSDISPGSLLLFGQSVFATIPADDDARRRQLLQRFQSTDKDAFVEHEQMRGLMQVVCVARNEADAKRIQDRLNDYFQLSRMHLIPPWSPDADGRTLEQHAAHERARQTYRKITDLYPNAFSDPALRALITESGKAQREGDPRRAKELREKHQQLAKDLRRREVEKLRESAATDPTLHVELIDRYLKIEGDAWDQDFFKRATTELGPLMGQVQMDGDNPAPGADRYNASGHVLAEGTKLRCFGISFTSTSDGAPAFARWLSTEGCSEFLYELRPANADLDDLEDLEESL